MIVDGVVVDVVDVEVEVDVVFDDVVVVDVEIIVPSFHLHPLKTLNAPKSTWQLHVLLVESSEFETMAVHFENSLSPFVQLHSSQARSSQKDVSNGGHSSRDST